MFGKFNHAMVEKLNVKILFRLDFL